MLHGIYVGSKSEYLSPAAFRHRHKLFALIIQSLFATLALESFYFVSAKKNFAHESPVESPPPLPPAGRFDPIRLLTLSTAHAIVRRFSALLAFTAGVKPPCRQVEMNGNRCEKGGDERERGGAREEDFVHVAP